MEVFLRKWEFVFSKMGVCFFENGRLFFRKLEFDLRKWEFVFSKIGV